MIQWTNIVHLRQTTKTTRRIKCVPSSVTRPWACPGCPHALSPAEGSVQQGLTGMRHRAACSGMLCTFAGWDSARPARTRRGHGPLCSQRCWSPSHSASWTLFSPGDRRSPGAGTPGGDVSRDTEKMWETMCFECSFLYFLYVFYLQTCHILERITHFSHLSPPSITILTFKHDAIDCALQQMDICQVYFIFPETCSKEHQLTSLTKRQCVLI